MATIKIEYDATKVVAPADREVLPIASMFEPNGSYVDSEPYAGTVYDTNVPGNGEWEGLADYLSKVSTHPGILIMFKGAVEDGSAQFNETDAKVIQYYKDLGKSLENQGFTVTVTEATSDKS